MKNLFAIKLHSYIDIITNSSSELYVCDKSASVESIKQLLESLCAKYNVSYYSTFSDIYIIDETNIDDFIEDYVFGWGVEPVGESFGLHDFWDLYRTAEHLYPFKYPYNENEEYNSEISDKREAYYKKVVDEETMALKNNSDRIQKLLGTICIFSADDNSIPWEMMEELSDLNMNRYHLG